MPRAGATTMQYRAFRTEAWLSVIGLGGMTLVGLPEGRASRLAADAVDAGVNYFDVAPFYGDGEAEEKLGIALKPYRKEIFLACKTLERDAEGACRELERSLRRLRTDRFDLYQFHAVSSLDEVEEICAPGGAAEALLAAREQGMFQYLGFSAHSEEAALAMLERLPFDSALVPVNYVCWARGSIGPRVVRRAGDMGVSVLALKAMAYGRWRRGEERRYPNCWYRPIDDPILARKALRFTLSEKVVAAIPPGDERLFRMALGLARDFEPLGPREREELLASAARLRPVL